MTDETLIADLVRAGVAADLVGRVANALAVSSVRDNVRDMVREYERARKQKQRGNHDKSGGKQTMSAAVSMSEQAKNRRQKRKL